jgi:carbonic anhydrase/acetyltransferase-like protein (isoleucine patch superfamily)
LEYRRIYLVLLEHEGKRPQIDESVYIAPTATVSGDVWISRSSRVLFGAVLTAEGGPIVIGKHCIVMENAVIRGSARHPVYLGDHVLVGPRAYLSGCEIEDSVFLATGATVFNGAHIGTRSEVRINGVVHLKTVLPPDTTVPIGWIAVGDPPEILPPDRHDEIWSIQEKLDFAGEVFGLERGRPGEALMPQLTLRYSKSLARHKQDRALDLP